MESSKQQIEEVRSKTQPEHSETKTTPMRVWIRPTHSTSVAFSWEEDTNEEEITSKKIKCSEKAYNYLQNYELSPKNEFWNLQKGRLKTTLNFLSFLFS